MRWRDQYVEFGIDNWNRRCFNCRLTRSSAVAERPRGASCMSVVSFNSKWPTYYNVMLKEQMRDETAPATDDILTCVMCREKKNYNNVFTLTIMNTENKTRAKKILERKVLLLVTSASDLPMHTIKIAIVLCSLWRSRPRCRSCNKQYPPMRRSLRDAVLGHA